MTSGLRGWPLSAARCPCDLDLLDWLRLTGPPSRVVLHFGTGLHHAVGRGASESGAHTVLGVTASAEEFAGYLDLVRREPGLPRRYQVLCTDIYALPASLVPPLDVLTLFHLCEFSASPDDDRALLARLSGRVRPGGHVLFYTGSDGFARTRPLLEEAIAAGSLVPEGTHLTLSVCRIPA